MAPSFVEAIGGRRDATPEPRQIAAAEELLVRLETGWGCGAAQSSGTAGRAARLRGCKLGFALRVCSARGSRLASQPATDGFARGFAAGGPGLQAAGGRRFHHCAAEACAGAGSQRSGGGSRHHRTLAAAADYSGNCGAGPGAKWQLLRHRFQKAIAEGASTSQVTAISVLASIYLQAVIAASMEEVELFLAPLTARSKVREVLRGLVATRQVHTISLGHAPHFYVAGTLPEFAPAPTIYASSSMPASSYFLHALWITKNRARRHRRRYPAPHTRHQRRSNRACP